MGWLHNFLNIRPVYLTLYDDKAAEKSGKIFQYHASIIAMQKIVPPELCDEAPVF
ncbi:hypothetical protein KoxyNG13_014350 [Klebsiella pasteurii]